MCTIILLKIGLSLLFVAPVALLGESATTTTIKVVVEPPEEPGEILRYGVAIGSTKCEIQAGPATPSCTLNCLAAGTHYNASAYSFGYDDEISSKTFGTVSTLPDGK